MSELKQRTQKAGTVKREVVVAKEFAQTKDEIKKLTKQVIKTCAPQKQREGELVATCNMLTGEIERSRIKYQNNNEDYQAYLEDQLNRCFTEFAQIIGMKNDIDYVKSLYTDFVKK